MSLAHLLFSFQGRTRRLHYWLFSLAEIVLVVAIAALFVPGMFAEPPQQPPLAYNLFCLALLYPATAVTVKRTNDIGWSPLWAWSISAMSAAFALLDMYSPFGDISQVMNAPNMAIWALFAAAVVMAIVIGCIPSAKGTTTHGPSPLALAA